MPPTPESPVPSAARVLDAFEVRELAETAVALPDSWVLVVEPPFGQLALTPRRGRRRFHRAWVADGAARLVRRDVGLNG